MLKEDRFEKLSDPEKVLAFIEVAGSWDVPVEEKYIDSYVYLLKTRWDIPFNYSFVFHPLPYSAELRRDLLGLKMAGYIKSASLVITQKGKEWIIKRQTILPEFKELLERIKTFIIEFRLFDRKSISDAVYARIA